MKRLVKIMLFIVVAIVLAAIALVVLRNVIVKSAVIFGFNSATKMKVQITRLDIGLFKPYIEVSGVKVINPAVSADEVMIDLPELYVAYSLKDILNNRMFFPRIKVELKEMILIRDKNGVANIQPLQALLPKGGGKPPELRIDLLELKVGKVIYKDYSLPSGPMLREFKLNLDQTYRNIDKPDKLISLLLVSVLGKTGFDIFSAFDLQGTKNNLISGIKDSGKKAVDSFQADGKSLNKGVETTVNEAAKSLKGLLGK